MRRVREWSETYAYTYTDIKGTYSNRVTWPFQTKQARIRIQCSHAHVRLATVKYTQIEGNDVG